MGMKCPACGGFLDFNPATQKLECPYCDSSFDADTYYKDNECIKVDTYCCKNCGAELLAPEEQIVSYCMYCGGEATLLQKATGIEKPVGIIPFKHNKEFVKSEYEKAIKKIPFVPKDFHKQEFLEGFRGIYIPYYKISGTLVEEQSVVQAVESKTVGNTEIKSFYDLKIEAHGDAPGGAYDASEAFDDTIAQNIAPFHQEEIVSFNPSYISGFYADKATVAPEVYNEKADDRIAEELKEEIKISTEGMEAEKEVVKSCIKWNIDKYESLLFPVWFLTWKNKKRVCYSVMNGETGKLSVELPVDYGKFFLWSILVCAIFSAVLCLMPMFVIPVRVAVYSSILLYISSYIYRAELKKISSIENHEFDLGSKARDQKFSKQKKLTGKGCLLALVNIAHYIFLFLVIQAGFIATSQSKNFQDFLFFMIFFQGILMGKQLIQLKQIKNKTGIITIILSVLLQIASFAIAKTGVQADIWIYLISMICTCGMIANIITSIFYINYIATRPVPNFYSREGADNGR